ncbi:MAG: Uncharacterised protein [SAR116 cluster bacterium]|nr:MAG: Uncharacterised protein [SAR116 cluster bacterium]
MRLAGDHFQCSGAFFMSEQHFMTAVTRPAAVPIHDNGDMMRNIVHLTTLSLIFHRPGIDPQLRRWLDQTCVISVSLLERASSICFT